jgi:hypothetical protein
MRPMRRDALQIGANALANSSQTPVHKSDLIAILTTGDGPGHLVSALFEDCNLESLERMAAQVGMTSERLRCVYAIARERHSVRNAEMESDEGHFPSL